MTDVWERVLNPALIATMIGAGLAYSRLLWSLRLYPTASLLIVGVLPGLIYMLTVWAIRAIQGVPSLVYIGLTVDWLIFAGTAVAAVLIARRRHHR